MLIKRAPRLPVEERIKRLLAKEVVERNRKIVESEGRVERRLDTFLRHSSSNKKWERVWEAFLKRQGRNENSPEPRSQECLSCKMVERSFTLEDLEKKLEKERKENEKKRNQKLPGSRIRGKAEG